MALVTLTPRWVVQARADLLQGCGWNGEGKPFFAPGTVNLVPFRTLGDGYILAGNLIMFLPFGFFPRPAVAGVHVETRARRGPVCHGVH